MLFNHLEFLEKKFLEKALDSFKKNIWFDQIRMLNLNQLNLRISLFIKLFILH